MQGASSVANKMARTPLGRATQQAERIIPRKRKSALKEYIPACAPIVRAPSPHFTVKCWYRARTNVRYYQSGGKIKLYMEKILYNLALVDSINYCKENGIDCSGTHLFKYPRRFTYALVKDETGEAILTTTFHKNSIPTRSLNYSRS